MRKLAARESGYQAFRRGDAIDDCPTETLNPARIVAWRDGWRQAFHESHTPNGVRATSTEQKVKP